MAEVQGMAQSIVDGLRLIAGVIAIGSLIWSGILWMTAAGNPRQLEGARAAFIGAIVGFAIVVFAEPIAASVGVVGGG